ncbi:carboxylesterase/lipase family protein [Streptomyces sp. NPDC006879]|uniref:carboxylesterase/lipase family protein n=1 Tax=Streptomyces sp. NPDC006879 TaxID=3364767 RepID=UPI00369FCA5B
MVPEASPTAGAHPEARTTHGRVRGRWRAGVAVFRGIPYAAPPFGVHRFMPPAAPEPWSGVREAATFGPTAPKVPYRPPFDQLLADPAIAGDDCLNLNIWTPSPSRADRLPVMVWIHGGGLTRGSSAVPVYDGTSFARDGIVLVTLNYRLGVEGFGLFPDAPCNLGIRDQIAALRWVHENIGGFGGDPDRVTVFGESAGAISIGTLLASPAARGLFHRAALQSGAPETLPRSRVRAIITRMADRLGIPATAAAFRAVDRAALLNAQGEVTRRSSPLLGGPSFGIVSDGDTVPRPPLEALIEGDAVDVPLLLGWTTQEHRLWLAPTKLLPRLDRLGPLTLAAAMARCRRGPAAVRACQRAHPGAGPGEVLGQMVADHLLRDPLRRLAASRPPGAPAYLYEFAWQSQVPDLGACHALELGFVFDTAGAPDSIRLAGPGAPQELADRMHRAWVDFATAGTPGWAAWDEHTRPIKVFRG